MKFFTTFLWVALLGSSVFAQPTQLPSSKTFSKEEVEIHLKYIASDELAGRRTGSEGNEKAARYIAGQFLAWGVQQAPESNGFLQKIAFENIQPPKSGFLKLENSEYKVGEDFLVLNGDATDLQAEAVFANYGWIDEATGQNDYRDLDVKGKIVFVLPSAPGSRNPMDLVSAIPKKKKWAAERGAAALIELFRIQIPWQYFKGYFGNDRLEMADNEAVESRKMLYGWLKEGSTNPVADLEKGESKTAHLSTPGTSVQRMFSSNVVGVIPGSDERLKNEHVLLSAHYDHVGTGKQSGQIFTPQDSIFNGARDNGIGTVALLAAAKSFAANPPKRSIVLLACTGEELGMLGSAYYADHPLIPLEKTVFNLNNDGAGYNSTEHISIIGWGRTNTDEEVEAAANSFGLKVAQDPAPEQNLYERSDNISFASKGIPAICFSPGVIAMDEAIFKYYHQATDNPETIDFDYLFRFCQAFEKTARLIADKPGKITWTPGDKFERK